MSRKKLASGNGWSFVPADGGDKAETESLPDDRQKATVKLERRPGGREVTSVSGFVLAAADRKALAAALKKKCGSGGGDSGESIEIQGDHRETVKSMLTERKWKVKG